MDVFHLDLSLPSWGDRRKDLSPPHDGFPCGICHCCQAEPLLGADTFGFYTDTEFHTNDQGVLNAN